MHAVEIEQVISELAQEPFDSAEFAFAFVAAFGNKDTTLKRMSTGNNIAKELISRETINCDCMAHPDHIGFFPSLGGISTIKELKRNPIDMRVAGRLNKLYSVLASGFGSPGPVEPVQDCD